MATEDAVYEVEKILDFVSFTDAFERYFKHKKAKYSGIFSNDRFNLKKKGKVTIPVSKYFYQVKWRGYDRTELTWEPEGTLPTGVNLVEFKKLNNLPPMTTLRVSLTFKKNRRHYVPPVVMSEREEVSHELPFRISTHLLDDVNNGKFGVVPVPIFKKKKRQGIDYLKKGQEIYSVTKTVVKKTDENSDGQSLIRVHQNEDKSFVQSMIRNPNIVRICDSFFTEKEDSIEITFLYEWSHQTLRQKVVQEKVVDWKRVARDILNALSYIHQNGIHQSVSLDNIHYHSNGSFKLSHFKNFVSAQQIVADDVKSESAELAPRKFGVLNAPFDTSIDIYALAIVLLQCKRKAFFRLDPSSVTEIEEDIEKAMTELATDQERNFVRMMLRAREHIHRTRLGSWRFSAKALLMHQLFEPTVGMKSVECFYFHHLLGFPVKEDLYYQPGDSVQTVILRHLSHYHDILTLKTKYMMIIGQSFDAPHPSTLILDRDEDFLKVMKEDVKGRDKKLLIFPTLTVPVTEAEIARDIVAIYEQELGGCPIVIESARISDVDLAKFLKKHVIRPEYRLFQVQLFCKQKSTKKSKKSTPDLFTDESNQLVLKIMEDERKFDIQSRFLVKKASEPQWNDVVGNGYLPNKKRAILEDLEENQENFVVGKQMRMSVEHDEQIDIIG